MLAVNAVHSGSIICVTCPLPPGRTNEPTSEESKKKPVKRTNSFSRRKNKGKGDESGGGDGDGYSGDSDALQKPAFKLEEQKDPLREALQQEAGTRPGTSTIHTSPRHQPTPPTLPAPTPPGPSLAAHPCRLTPAALASTSLHRVTAHRCASCRRSRPLC